MCVLLIVEDSFIACGPATTMLQPQPQSRVNVLAAGLVSIQPGAGRKSGSAKQPIPLVGRRQNRSPLPTDLLPVPGWAALQDNPPKPKLTSPGPGRARPDLTPSAPEVLSQPWNQTQPALNSRQSSPSRLTLTSRD